MTETITPLFHAWEVQRNGEDFMCAWCGKFVTYVEVVAYDCELAAGAIEMDIGIDFKFPELRELMIASGIARWLSLDLCGPFPMPKFDGLDSIVNAL